MGRVHWSWVPALFGLTSSKICKDCLVFLDSTLQGNSGHLLTQVLLSSAAGIVLVAKHAQIIGCGLCSWCSVI